ncbi:MAG: 50S ribosomal protein L31e [Candidatus Bathyarchaeota archaeon BA2]|nr:MAG: 50S ribosomal protein L31e [Candidatus Bathyarchaeota archaeon BA2]
MEEKVEITEEAEEEEARAEEIEEAEEEEVLAEEAEERPAEEEKEEETGEEPISEAEEEREVKEEKKRVEEEEIVEEKFYTIPLRRAWISPRKKRAPRAMRILKSFVMKHMKLRTEAEGEEEAERLVVSNEVNERIWSRGIEKPPRKISVRAVKDKEGVVTVYLAEGD